MNEYGVSTQWHDNEREGDRLYLNPTPMMAYQDTLDTLLADFPPVIKARGWIGAVRAWLTHPRAGEEETFAEALHELNRLRKEVEA